MSQSSKKRMKSVSMTESYLQFMTGEAPSSEGQSIANILRYTSTELEADHAFIQWIFPLPEPSRFNPYAPVIDIAELKRALDQKGDPRIQKVLENHDKATQLMLKFWGIVYNPENHSIDCNMKKLICLNGHNGLRFSRFLQSLVYHGNRDKAERVLNAVLVKVNDGSKKLKPSMDHSKRRTIWELCFNNACELMEQLLTQEQQQQQQGDTEN
jgi:hypothetical protein